MIVEVTPTMRPLMGPGHWSTAEIEAAFLGKCVEVGGWMFADLEHTNAAENTSPQAKKPKPKPGHKQMQNWRATVWEIHPVESIVLSDKCGPP
jgi:hypothetical protein